MHIFNKLSALDITIFSVFIFATIGIAFLFRIRNLNKSTSASDYILMGRKLTLPLFVATLVSSWYGGIFGVTQIAFQHGIYNFITQGFFWYIAYFIFAFLLTKKIHQKEAITFPDLIKKSFGKNSAKLAAILLVFKVLPITYAVSIGIFIKTVFGFSLELSIIIGTVLVLSYTCFSSFKSVVYSDFLQFSVMYIGVILVVVFSYFNLGGFTLLTQKLPAHYFSINGNHTFTTTLLWLFIAFSATLISPVFYQRCMAAKTPKVAKIGIIISALFWIVFDICTTLGGMYAKVYMPEADPINAYLLFGLEILPTGLKGLFLAGIVATIISTLDSFIFSTSTLFSYDLMYDKLKNLNLVRFISVVFTGVLTIIIALGFNGVIENIWITLEGYFGAILIIPIIWSYFIKVKISDSTFMIVAIITMLIMVVKDLFLKEVAIETFYFGVLTTLISYVFVTLFKVSCNLSKSYRQYESQPLQK